MLLLSAEKDADMDNWTGLLMTLWRWDLSRRGPLVAGIANALPKSKKFATSNANTIWCLILYISCVPCRLSFKIMEPTAPFHPTGACVSCQLRIVFLVEAAGNGLEMKLIRRNSELGNPKWRQIVCSLLRHLYGGIQYRKSDCTLTRAHKSLTTSS